MTPPRRILALMLLTVAALVLVTASASAAPCGAVDRARYASATRIVQTGADQPARIDARALVARARRSCAASHAVVAIADAARRWPQPSAGERRALSGIVLRAVPSASGAVWRVDVDATASSVARRGLRRVPMPYAGRSAAPIWTEDPTRPAWDPAVQARVAHTLWRSRDPLTRRHAANGVAAFAPQPRRASVTKLPLLQQLTVVGQLVRIPVSNPAVVRARSVLVAATYAKVRTSVTPGWSRLDGAWSTIDQHRVLVARARALLRVVPHRTTGAVVARLARQLAAPPDVRFRALPTGEFYPEPRDGAYDTQSFTVHLDKPAVIRVDVYSETIDGAIRTLELSAAPGDAVIEWDGTNADGTTQPPGDYLYVVDVTDLTGRRTRTPGLEPFRIRRDTTPPVVRAASITYLTSGGTPRVLTSWDVDEPHSPNVRTQLVLSRAGRSVTVLLDTTTRVGSSNRALRLGAGSWTAQLVVTDGSGNVTRHDLRTITVR